MTVAVMLFAYAVTCAGLGVTVVGILSRRQTLAVSGVALGFCGMLIFGLLMGA